MVYRMPDQLRQRKETLWGPISMVAFYAMLVCGGIGIVIYKILESVGLGLLGVIIALVLVLLGFVMWTVAIPDSNVLHGGGLLLGVYLFRRIIHKREKAIYYPVFDAEEEDEDDEDENTDS